jgi:threonyl-tRNA synthetase
MEERLLKIRHSSAHIMADAVQHLFPAAKLGIGPAIENGFYYDFDLEQRFIPEDLQKIEKKMREIVKKKYDFKQTILSKAEAKKLFQEKGEIYKLKLLDDIEDNEVSIYEHGDFSDLCKGPHLDNTAQVGAFKLLSIAGAYWRGDESNKMLQRIYGAAFATQEELDLHIERLKEAEARDHRKLGKELNLFTFFPQAGAGLVFYLPKGWMLKRTIEDYIFKKHIQADYKVIQTPQILKADVWRQSGHYDYYKENMYIFQKDDVEYAIKPMNCPGHIMVYQAQRHSYRDLPLRLFEAGSVYRHEKTGVLHGLLRVRGFTQDDAHIFCREDQLEEEIKSVIKFTQDIMLDFDFKDFKIELSTRPKDSIGTDRQWQKATAALQNSLKSLELDYDTCAEEGAFYGPKIDIKLKDAIGRFWQCATIQCDFAGPERFDVNYIGEDGEPHRIVMLHRAILGSLERFIGTLIEHYGGDFPLWLAPEQLRLLPISEKFLAYMLKLKRILEQQGFRVSVDSRSETLGYKIREAEIEKIPYLLIAGEKEQRAESISLRSRKDREAQVMDLNMLTAKLKEEIGGKTL